MRTVSIAIGALLSSTALLTAEAADIGYCAPPAEMTETLKAEGQMSLVYGDQTILYEILPDGSLRDARGEQRGLIFTADAQGNVGYLVQADQPVGTPATRMCIGERFHKVRLYDARKPGVPQDALVNSTAADAARRCYQIAQKGTVNRDACTLLNHGLQRLDAVGERVMLQGSGVSKQADGTYRENGSLVTITGNLTGDGSERDGRGAMLYTVLPEGSSVLASVFLNTSYTANALNLLPR